MRERVIVVLVFKIIRKKIQVKQCGQCHKMSTEQDVFIKSQEEIVSHDAALSFNPFKKHFLKKMT